MIFGKKISEYVAFQTWILLAIIATGILRPVLFELGVPSRYLTFVSMTAVSLVGLVYYGIRVHTTRFGTFKHLLPLVLFQSGLSGVISAAGVSLAGITRKPNIYTAPEFSNAPNYWPHAIAHVLGGFTIVPLVSWLLAAAVMGIAKRVGARDAIRR